VRAAILEEVVMGVNPPGQEAWWLVMLTGMVNIAVFAVFQSRVECVFLSDREFKPVCRVRWRGCAANAAKIAAKTAKVAKVAKVARGMAT